ncbi:MAG: hypothetical protein LC640_13805 [Frankia sp.]|nr:hypothetical protein [Frankia sp.]
MRVRVWVICLLGASLLPLGCSRDGTTSAPSSPATTTTASASASALPYRPGPTSTASAVGAARGVRATAAITLPRGSDGTLFVDGGAVWVIGNRALLRIDPVSNRVTRTVRIAAGEPGFAFALGSVWVPEFDAGTVGRYELASGRRIATLKVAVTGIDTKANRVARRVTLSDFVVPFSLTAAQDRLWVLSGETLDALVGVDAANGNETGTLVLPQPGTGAVAVGSRVWVPLSGDPPSATSGTVLGVDTSTVRAVDAVTLPGEATSVVAGFGSLWFTLPAKNEVVRVPLTAFAAPVR